MNGVAILQAFTSDTCRCGAPKRPHLAFCAGCFNLLPIEKRQTLYRKFGKGFEDAYEAAVQHLDVATTACTCGRGDVDSDPACPMHSIARTA